MRGDTKRAISILARYVDHRPHDPMAWLLLGAALDRVARYEEAEDVLREGLERHPDFHELRGKLAQVLYIQWKFEEARQQWALVLQSNPSAPDAYEGLPSMSIWEGDQAQARSLIEESIRRNPDPVLSMDLASILVSLPAGRPQAEILLHNATKAKGFRRDPLPHLLLAMFL
ncbi:MAG TPA: tetratricopeptide repeat protein [Actinomycetota bacterium]|nr:tetratricopeptide repeat protein [Actinomycetota bacterium]